MAAVASALRDIGGQDLHPRFDAAEMNRLQIYPQILDEGEGALSYVLGHYEPLRKYYLDAATRGDAMIVFLM